jgi:hypothetical protein
MGTMMKKLWRLGIVYLVAVNLLQISPALAGGPPAAAAENFHGRVEVTFIKWVTNWPNMAGVVSGDVGGGLLPGRSLTTTIRTPLIRSRLFITSTAGPSNLPRTTL